MLPEPLKALVTVAGIVLLATTACSKSEPTSTSSSAPAASQGPPRSFVEVRPKKAEGELVALLAKHTKAAHDEHLAIYASLGATWCKPCRELEEAMSDARMQEAFRGTYIVHIDVDEWSGQLAKTGLNVAAVPTIIALDDTGKGTKRTIDGSAWKENVPANMAGPLGRYFHPGD